MKSTIHELKKNNFKIVSKKLVFGLVATVAFAFSGFAANDVVKEVETNSFKTEKTSEVLDFKIDKVVFENNTSCLIYYTVYRKDGSIMGSFTVATTVAEDCGMFVGYQLNF